MNDDHLMKSLDDIIAERKSKSQGHHNSNNNQQQHFQRKGISKNKDF